jgi:hypothetical protein
MCLKAKELETGWLVEVASGIQLAIRLLTYLAKSRA